MKLIMLLLLAVPLQAQTDSLVFTGTFPSPIVIVNGDSIFVSVEVGTDSLVRSVDEGMASLTAAVQAIPQPASQSAWSKGFQTVLVGALLWGVYEFRQWRQKEAVPNVHQDGDVNVTFPPHEDHHRDKSGKSNR